MSSSQNKRPPRIEPATNGPYLVHELENLSNSRGENLETKPTVALCRCGRSASKPFCDGTHAKVGFESKTTSDGSLDRRDDYTSGRLTLHDNRGICAHAARCTDDLASVFRLKQEPWIDPAGAGEDAVIAQVRACPSGALSYSIDSAEHRDQERQPAIFVSRDGPYFVTGNVDLQVDRWGADASKEHYTLCRCGGSKNKPFCDGTHWKGFKDDKN